MVEDTRKRQELWRWKKKISRAEEMRGNGSGEETLDCETAGPESDGITKIWKLSSSFVIDGKHATLGRRSPDLIIYRHSAEVHLWRHQDYWTVWFSLKTFLKINPYVY